MSTNVEQIKERLDIADVISSYIKIEKAGINFKAKCPFHNEKTPSFFISPARQSFYCFGCGEKGDVFSFVQKFEGLDFKGALKVLADRAGVELKNFKEDGKSREEKDELFEIMEKAAKFYEQNLRENKKNEEYLKKRGLTEETISKWRLGFALDEWRSLHDKLEKEGFSKEQMLAAGLIKTANPSADGNSLKSSSGQAKYYDTFRNRVMFPIFENAGQVIAFSGRAMKEDDKTPKYLNSPETKLFYKSDTLYGFNVAKNHIRKLDYAVLVEGQMDLLMSHQAGVGNTVASSGTALTELHLKKIQKLTNRVIVAYDSDSAGEKAARKAAEMALSMGMEVKIASLPEGEDPASVAKESTENWKNALRKSDHIVDSALKKAIREKSGRSLAKEIFTGVLPLVAMIKSEIEKSQFVKKIALEIGVREEAIWDDLKKINKPEIKIAERFLKEEIFAKNKKINLDRIMASLIFLEESIGKKEMLDKWLAVAPQKEVRETLADYEPEKESLIFEAENFGNTDDLEKIKTDMIKRVELESLKKKLQTAAIALDQKNISDKEAEETRNEMKKIQKRIKEIGL